MKSYLFPSSKQWYNLDVVGEYYHNTEIRRAALAVEQQSDGSYHFPVTLVAEPDNPHNTNGHAISVRNGKDVLGYIASEMSSDYFPEVARVCASGYLPKVNARLWCSGDLLGRDSNLYLYLSILDPGRNVPLNNPPSEGWALIPYGNSFQVTKESDHFDVLQDYIPPSGTGALLVTLHKEMLGAKTKRIGLEVRLDGERVGELTKAASEKLMPMVDHYDALGLTSVARAIIQGSGLAAELTVHVKRAHELEDEDLEPEVSPLGRLVDFEADPNNYAVPNAWQGDSSNKKSKAAPRSAADPIPSFVKPEPQPIATSESSTSTEPSANEFVLNFTDSPNNVFDILVTPEEFEADTEIKYCQVAYLTGNEFGVTVLSKSGKVLGRLNEPTSRIVGPGIEHIEKRGEKPTTLIKIKLIGSKLFGEIGIRKNTFEYFRGQVPQSILDAPFHRDLANLTTVSIPDYGSFSESTINPPMDSGYQAAPSQSILSAQQQFSIQQPTPAPAHIDSSLMWILWFFTGLFGGHRYYLGNIGIGILQTLTAGGLGFWWVLDALLITRRKRAVNNQTAPRWTF